MDNDLNVSEALAALFDMVHEGNRAMDAGQESGDPGAVERVFEDADRVLGVLPRPAEDAGDDVVRLVAEREDARKARDWAKADAIRDRLAEAGWQVKDTAGGPKLKRARPS
jgi:cysteinyl-tRNA synthetase